MGLATGLFFQRLLQLLPALVGAEVGRIHQGNALAAGERLGALPDHHHVRRMLHHRFGEQDRIAHALHAGHGTGLERGAIHQRGIQFIATVVGEYRPFAGIEGGIVLEHGDRRGNGFQRRPARRQCGMPFQQRLLQGRARGFFLGGREILALHPRSAMDDQHRLGGGGRQRERQAQRQHHHSRTRHGQAL